MTASLIKISKQVKSERQLVTFESSQQWLQMAFLSKPMGGISPTFTGMILRLVKN